MTYGFVLQYSGLWYLKFHVSSIVFELSLEKKLLLLSELFAPIMLRTIKFIAYEICYIIYLTNKFIYKLKIALILGDDDF